MRVNYFIDIIKVLLKKGASQKEIADTLGFSKQNMTEILGGVPEKQRKNLKDEHLPGLVKLCKRYGVAPKNGNKLLELIEKEKQSGRL